MPCNKETVLPHGKETVLPHMLTKLDWLQVYSVLVLAMLKVIERHRSIGQLVVDTRIASPTLPNGQRVV